MMRIPACLLVSLMVILWGCADEKNEPKGGKPSVIFADYRFTGDDGKEMVTGLLQFFEGSRKGEPMRLTPPAGIQVDGVALVADSALRTGAYYEVQQPLQQFRGKHTLILTDEHGQTHREAFEFEPLLLQTELGPTVKRGALELEVSGVQKGDKVRVLLTDIDFDTDDINRLQTVTDGKLVISAEELQTVAAGPVTLMLYKEVEKTLEKGTLSGGRLSITYGLSREFNLVD